jgi:hypothetical protein
MYKNYTNLYHLWVDVVATQGSHLRPSTSSLPQEDGIRLRTVIIPNDSEEAQALRHYGSYLKATGDPRAIVPEDPNPKRSPGDCKDTHGYLRLLVAIVNFRPVFGKCRHGPLKSGGF